MTPVERADEIVRRGLYAGIDAEMALRGRIAGAIAEAVAEEREACAGLIEKVAEYGIHESSSSKDAAALLHGCAAVIRRRGQS